MGHTQKLLAEQKLGVCKVANTLNPVKSLKPEMGLTITANKAKLCPEGMIPVWGNGQNGVGGKGKFGKGKFGKGKFGKFRGKGKRRQGRSVDSYKAKSDRRQFPGRNFSK